MAKIENEVVEAEFTEVEEVKEEAVVEVPRCELIIGVKEDGSLYFTIGGSDQSLVTAQGLLTYAEMELRRIWEARVLNRQEEQVQE